MRPKATLEAIMKDERHSSQCERLINDLVVDACTEVLADRPFGLLQPDSTLRMLLRTYPSPWSPPQGLAVEAYEQDAEFSCAPSCVGYITPSNCRRGFELRCAYGIEGLGYDDPACVMEFFDCHEEHLQEVGQLWDDVSGDLITGGCSQVFAGGTTGRVHEGDGYGFVLRGYRTGWIQRPCLAVEMHEGVECSAYPLCTAYLRPNVGLPGNSGQGCELQYVHCVAGSQGAGHGRRMWDFLVNHLAPFTVAHASPDSHAGMAYLLTMIEEPRDRYPAWVAELDGEWEGVYIGPKLSKEVD